MKKLILLLSVLAPFISWSQDYCEIGTEKYIQENYAEAIENLERCLKNDPKNKDALYFSGRSYAQLEKWEKATHVYEKLVKAYPANAQYNFLYGGSLGLYAKSLSPLKSVGYISDIKFYLKKAILLDEKHIEARWALVQIYIELPYIVGGSKSTSEEYAKELLRISPIDGHLAFGYIEAYEENWAKAEKHYQKAVQVGQSETAYRKLVDVQIQQNKIEEAKVTLREAYRITQKEHFKKLLEEF